MSGLPARVLAIALVAALGLLPISAFTAGGTAMTAPLLLDDFRKDDGVSALGTRWEGFTDRVMGGRSDASAWQGIRIKVRGAPGPYYLHLRTRQTWQPWQHFRAARIPPP